MDRQPVDLVRVPKEERYYDREAVLGRDAASVFPTESRRAAVAGGEALAELLGGGNRKFISETELEEIKTARGGLSMAGGLVVADKPLAEVLRAAKDAKEAEFQEKWKTMKTGKNRPLDEDELQFLDEVAAAQAARLKAQAREEDAELAAFLEAQQQQQQQQQGGGRGGAGGAAEAAGMAGGGDGDEAALAVAPPQLQQHAGAAAARPKRPPPLVAVKALVRPVVRVAKPSAGGGCEPEAKRPRAEPGQQRQQEPVGGSDGPSLAGLLGGYGSGSEEEAD